MAREELINTNFKMPKSKREMLERISHERGDKPYSDILNEAWDEYIKKKEKPELPKYLKEFILEEIDKRFQEKEKAFREILGMK